MVKNIKTTFLGLLAVLCLSHCKKDESLSINTWSAYKADAKATSYSPLDQINIPNVDQEEVDAVAQATKQGFIFVLDRETGEPIFPVEERQVPVSNLPGEVAYETQPFPLKPKPFVRQSMTEDDLTNYSTEDHEAILEKFRSVRFEGLFTPPDLNGTLSIPATRGGANWGGLAL